ncbi:hypothetical protein Acr_00g0017170 [Actinidia rufa]|uniref:Uncharacterized protein n=1 Tax=Actinidia rufa TaxID=165716 RepID=A0A7J0DBP8_9ERIC|nr:hypothetical protein Acr_00g0017170 [Actinidia rufa]
MHLRSCRLPRPSASIPLDNRAHPMANTSQVPDLEGLHREIHGMAEQMRIMNENNARLMQHLTINNPPPPASPAPSHRSHRSGNNESQNHRSIGRNRRRRPPIPRRRERSSSSESRSSSETLEIEARNAPVTIDALIRQTEPPFTKRIMRTRVSSKFELPTQIEAYEGKTDPMDHLHSYKSLMSLHGYSDEALCLTPFSKKVPTTLSALLSKADKYIITEELAKPNEGGVEGMMEKEGFTAPSDEIDINLRFLEVLLTSPKVSLCRLKEVAYAI